MDYLKLLKQGVLYPKRFIEGRSQQSSQKLEGLQPGHGGIVEAGGNKVAAYKDGAGQVLKFSPVCTHMGCIVGWNDNDKTWDCPCHGSRFNADGSVKNGPAQKPLKKLG